MTDPIEEFFIDEDPEWTLESDKGDLLQSCYAFNWEQVQETLAKLRRFRYIQPTDAREVMIKGLLPVVDGFERIFALAEQNGAWDKDELRNWLKSFEGVYKRLLKILSRQGVSPIESVGQLIDLDHHEVVDVVSDDKAEPGTVIREELKGYRIQDRVLRDARVIVAKPNSEQSAKNSSRETNSGQKEEA